MIRHSLYQCILDKVMPIHVASSPNMDIFWSESRRSISFNEDITLMQGNHVNCTGLCMSLFLPALIRTILGICLIMLSLELVRFMPSKASSHSLIKLPNAQNKHRQITTKSFTASSLNLIVYWIIWIGQISSLTAQFFPILLSRKTHANQIAKK